MRKLVAAHTGDERLEEMAIEFHVAAVDVLTGEELLLSSGRCAADGACLRACAAAGERLGDGVALVEPVTHSRLIADIELHRDSAKLVVLPPLCPLAVQPIDFAHADELIERALDDARAFLDGGGAERLPIRMRMHRRDDPRGG